MKCGNALSLSQVQGLGPWLGRRGLVPDWGAGLAPLGLWAEPTLGIMPTLSFLIMRNPIFTKLSLDTVRIRSPSPPDDHATITQGAK